MGNKTMFIGAGNQRHVSISREHVFAAQMAHETSKQDSCNSLHIIASYLRIAELGSVCVLTAFLFERKWDMPAKWPHEKATPSNKHTLGRSEIIACIHSFTNFNNFLEGRNMTLVSHHLVYCLLSLLCGETISTFCKNIRHWDSFF